METFGVEETFGNWYDAVVKQLGPEKGEAVVKIVGSYKKAPWVKAQFTSVVKIGQAVTGQLQLTWSRDSWIFRDNIVLEAREERA